MLLVVDAGNTNIVFAVHDPSGWRGVWRIRTDAQRTSDEYAVWLNSLLSLCDLKRSQIRIAPRRGPDHQSPAKERCPRNCGLSKIAVGTGFRTGAWRPSSRRCCRCKPAQPLN